MNRREALALGPHHGGLAVKDKTPPDTCPLCGHSLRGYTWHRYLGHRGLHALADNHFNGNIRQAAKALATHDN